MTDAETTRARFAASAARMAAFNDARAQHIRDRLAELLELSGEDRALDVGTGTGPFALALAPLVREVIGLDLVPEMLEQARLRAVAYPNASFVEGEADQLPYPDGSFDVTMCARTLHHVERPAKVVAEMARVTRPGGEVLVLDQVAPDDADSAGVQETIEQLRDRSHVRTLPQAELREMLAAAGLELERVVLEPEERDLDSFLALAGCEGEARRPIFAFAQEALAAGRGGGIGLERDGNNFRFVTTVGWFVARRPQPSA